MSKNQIEDRILYKSREVYRYKDNRFKWGDVKKHLEEANIELKDTDVVMIQYEEGFDYPDNVRDPSYDLEVFRYREETDVEYETRVHRADIQEERSKAQREEQYHKLRKEFETA